MNEKPQSLEKDCQCNQRWLCSDISPYCFRNDYKMCPYYIPDVYFENKYKEEIQENDNRRNK